MQLSVHGLKIEGMGLWCHIAQDPMYKNLNSRIGSGSIRGHCFGLYRLPYGWLTVVCYASSFKAACA